MTPPVEAQPPAAISPQGAWAGVQWSMDNLNVDSWAQLLSPDFLYTPDPLVDARFPGVFGEWGAVSELFFIAELFNSEVKITAEMFPAGFEAPLPASTQAVWDPIEYWVRVSGVDGQSPVEYRGVAAVEFRLEGSFWHIYRWHDLRGGVAEWNPEVVLPTLGELRAVNRLE